MSRWRGLVLGVWALVLGSLLIFGRYTLFLRPQLWPLQLATLLILMFFLLAMIIRPAHAGSGRIRLAAWVRGGMLLLPLLYMSNLVSGAATSGLNSFALQKRSLGFTSALDSTSADIDTSAIPGANELISLAYLSKHTSRLMGNHVVVEGRVFKDDTLPAGEFTLFRFVVVCCAADAMPMQVAVKSSQISGLHNDDWVRVGGTLRSENRNGTQFIVIDADAVNSIPTPDEPYLSPYQL
ncbi:MAG: TIGR03943 family protein [Tepidisphaeraceae bacterium]